MSDHTLETDASSEQPLVADLSADERSILMAGVATWQGPGYRPHIVARALGLGGRTELNDVARGLEHALRTAQPLTPSAWARALLMTELGFASRVAGQGSQWRAVTGRGDAETIAALREIQGKLAPLLRHALDPAFLSPKSTSTARQR